MDDEEKIQLIFDYGDAHSNFCTEFAESLREALSEYGELTTAQSDALDRIIESFRMLAWESKELRKNKKPVWLDENG